MRGGHRRNVSVSRLQPIQENIKEHHTKQYHKNSSLHNEHNHQKVSESSSSQENKQSSSDTLSASGYHHVYLEELEDSNSSLYEEISDI